MKKVLVLHGPNLTLLGQREPDVYGILTLAALDGRLHAWGRESGWEVETFQSNHEGALLDKMHDAVGKVRFQVINPGAYTHTSYALRDAVAGGGVPTIEVHLSNVYAREPFRHVSVIAPVCRGQVSGLGVESYLAALESGARMFGEDAT
ncbi:MAG: type II 3-dehydroquinate dehydratase [Armatimonadetes bacterium]|nr:type II 3-dehydroquinate dehydratase [Armatimonadota bacterium]